MLIQLWDTIDLFFVVWFELEVIIFAACYTHDPFCCFHHHHRHRHRFAAVVAGHLFLVVMAAAVYVSPVVVDVPDSCVVAFEERR